MAVDLDDALLIAELPSSCDEDTAWAVYRLAVEERARYTFQTFGSRDSLLYLVDDQGRQLASNDDIERGNYCSRIEHTLAPGTYYVVVAEYGGNPCLIGLSTAGGGFEFTEEELTTTEEEMVERMGAFVREQEEEAERQAREARLEALRALTDSATPVVERQDVAVPRNGNVAFRLVVTEVGEVVFRTTGEMDTTLELLRDDGEQIAFNDDSNGLLSRISETLQPGTYYILVAGYAGGDGDCVLHVEGLDAITQPETPETPDAPQEGDPAETEGE